MHNFISNFNSILIQSSDINPFIKKNFKIVSKKKPSATEFKNLIFAFNICRFAKSNAIVLAKDNALIGMGAGQPNRVTSVYLALKIAGDRSQGTVLASDAFFPFADGIELAASGGVTAVIEPGGSVRDADIIETADRLNLALIFTGYRHFRH